MNEIKEPLLLEEDLELNSKESVRKSEILFEDTSKRSENAKHFRLKNGHYMATVYDKPIHFKDPESGEFRDLADRFCEKEDCYEADAGRFKVLFPKKEGKAKFVTVEKDGMSVSWRYLPKAAKRKNPEAIVFPLEKNQPTDLPRFPHLKYKKEDSQTNLEYGISEFGVKENIVLEKCPKDPTFRFELKLDGLIAALSEDSKQIKLCANNMMSDTPTLFIPPITMIDSAGVISEDAHYELTEEEGMTVLSVCASPEWLSAKERLYPVFIDPQVNVEEDNSFVQNMMYIRSDGKKFRDPYFAFVGRDSFGLENHIYTKFDFPELPVGANFRRATLSLHQSQNIGADFYDVYQISEPWDVDTISWSNPPYCRTTPLDTIQSQDRDIASPVTFDISTFARAYYNYNDSNYGLVIKRARNFNYNENSSCNTGGWICNNSVNTSSCDNNCSEGGSCSSLTQSSLLFYTYKGSETYSPSISVEYEMLEDFSDHQQYETFDAGASGVGGVSLSTGQLIYSINDIALSGGKLPLNLSHLYRSNVVKSSTSTAYGQGWFLSAAQTLTTLSNIGIKAAYRDAQGNTHYFNKDNQDDSGWYHDFNGLGLAYDGSGTVKDEKGNTMSFFGGRLKTITDAYGNSCTLSYNASKLTSITDSVNRTLTCCYNSSGRLDYIRDFSGRETHYSYTSAGNLEKILRPDGSYTLFTYSGTSTNTKLIRITDSSGIYFDITYDSAGRIETIQKIGTKKLENGTLSDTPAVNGGGMDFAYYDSSTVITDLLTGIKTVYRMDDCGHVLCSYEDLSSASMDDDGITPSAVAIYDVKINNTTKQLTNGCYPMIQASLNGTSSRHHNYLANSNFNSNPAGAIYPDSWSVFGVNTSNNCFGCSNDCLVNNGYQSGYQAYKFDNSLQTIKRISQTQTFGYELKGNVLIASAWAKSSNAVQASSTAKFELYAKIIFDDGSYTVRTAVFDSSVTSWQYNAMPLEIPTGKIVEEVTVRFDYSYNVGVCYVSNIRLSLTDGTITRVNHTLSPVNVFGESVPISHCIATDDGLQQVYTYYDYNFDAVKTEIQKDGRTFTNYAKYDGNHQPKEMLNYSGIITETEYNGAGYPDYIISYHVESPSYRTLIEPQYYEDTESVKTVCDTRGYETDYTYNAYGQVETVSKNNQICTYNYALNNQPSSLKIEDAEGLVSIQNDFTYVNNYLTNVLHNGFNYNFGYDPLGRVSAVSVAGNLLASYEYTNGTTVSHTTANYSNDQTTKVTSDHYGNPTRKQVNNVDYLTAKYDGKYLRKKIDKKQDLCYNYEYNTNGNVSYIYISRNSTGEQLGYKFFYYNRDNSLNYQHDSRIQQAYFPIYRRMYDANGVPVEFPEKTIIGTRLENVFEEIVDRDSLNRPSVRSLTLQGDSDAFIEDSYTYLPRVCDTDGNDTTDYINSFTHKVNGVGNTLTYEYDAAGNIAVVRQDDAEIATFAYDYLNRLTQETYVVDNTVKRVEYVYDNGGNLTHKNTYLGVSTEATQTSQYNYENTWKDQLTSINGQAITYDAIGNPLSYKGAALTWTDVNKLSSYGNHTFAYNGEGVRCRKNQVTYTLDGDRVLQETDGLVTLTYYYGMNGIVGFHYVNLSKDIDENYYYGKNAFGDVTAIYNEAGTAVAGYTYDAWGNIVDKYDDSTLSIGARNPIRYRGYYYDTETDLYYIGGRYYDPTTGRFINAADVSSLNVRKINGFNAYICDPNILYGSKTLSKTKLNPSNDPFIRDDRNYFDPHFESQWWDTGAPRFLVASKEGFELVNWGLSVWKGSLHLDHYEEQYLYISAGNVSTYAGINFEKGGGVDLSANVLEVGFDGKVIDLSVTIIGAGVFFKFENGEVEAMYDPIGWFGVSFSVDLIELFKFMNGE